MEPVVRAVAPFVAAKAVVNMLEIYRMI